MTKRRYTISKPRKYSEEIIDELIKSIHDKISVKDISESLWIPIPIIYYYKRKQND